MNLFNENYQDSNNIYRLGKTLSVISIHITMKNLLFCIFLLSVLFVNVQAQESFTISGYISDEASGEALISANIFESTTNQGTVANTYGFYSITLPADSVYLVFSYIGYQPQTIGLNLTKDVNLNIELATATFDVVEVVATRAERIEEKTQMSVVDVPIQQIKKMPALLGEVDVLKTLQLLPGVQSGGEGQSGLYVRGGSPDQNLILLDGVPVYNVNHLFGFFSVFNADAIKDVKLTKGGFPARYGGRLSSVLEINMKEGNMKEFHGAGSIGIFSSKLSLEGPIIKDKASFIISGRRTYIDLLARPLIKRGFDQEDQEGLVGYYFYDLNAKVNYKISDKDRLYLSAYTGDDKFYVDINDQQEISGYSEGVQSDLSWGNITTALRWNHQWNNKLFSNITGTYSRYNFGTLVGTTFEETENNTVISKENFSAGYDSGIDDLAVRLDIDWIPLPNHYVKTGGLVTQHFFNPGLFELKAEILNEGIPELQLDTLFGQAKVKALEYNVFVEDDYKINSGLKANFGLHFS